MNSLKKEIKMYIKEKINNNISINKISLSTGLSKATIYYYYKKIKGRKKKKTNYKINYSKVEGEVVGIFIGDGSQHYAKVNWNYQTNIHFGNNFIYVRYVKALYENYFNRVWSLYKDTSSKNIRYRLRAVDKKIFYYFQNYIHYNPHIKHSTVRLKNLDLPKGFKIGLIKGLIDTDGTVCKYDNRTRIMYTTTSKILAKQIRLLLQDLRIKSSVYRIVSKRGYKDTYNLQIMTKDINRFLNIIKPNKAENMGR